MTLDGNQINTITFFKQVEGEIYPEEELPENARKLRGFIWRGEERIKTKEDIFPPEENEYEERMKIEKEAEEALESVPMEVRQETLEGQVTEKEKEKKKDS
jgi:hypothetical protein